MNSVDSVLAQRTNYCFSGFSLLFIDTDYMLIVAPISTAHARTFCCAIPQLHDVGDIAGLTKFSPHTHMRTTRRRRRAYHHYMHTHTHATERVTQHTPP
jgi:hypothetical protein